ncbi:hypothetical protein YC2023_078276 [Brassica napus]
MPMERSSCKESIETNRVQIRGALEYEMGDAHMAIQARLMNQALHKLSHSLQSYSLFCRHYMVLSLLRPGVETSLSEGKLKMQCEADSVMAI